MPNLQTQRTICRPRGPEPEIPGALVQSVLGLHRVAEIELPPLQVALVALAVVEKKHLKDMSM